MFNKRATHKKWRLQRSPETFNIIALTNCTNIFHDVGHLNKVDNPASLQKIVICFPLPLRQSWYNKADDTTNNEQREINFQYFAKFVDVKARSMAHQVFGDIKR